MKWILSALMLFVSIHLMAQNGDPVCEPDTSQFEEGAVNVFPPPFDPDLTPDGGFQDPACINEDYMTQLDFLFPAVINFGGAMVVLDSFTFSPTEGVVGLPEGLGYACNPPSCTFVSTVPSCILISGQVAESVEADSMYLLEVAGMLWTMGFALNVDFPNPLLAPGAYTINVQREGTCDSVAASLESFYLDDDDIIIGPNPMADAATVWIYTDEPRIIRSSLFNAAGQQIRESSTSLHAGENQLQIEAAGLENGIYFFAVSDGKKKVTRKLIVKRK
jgi:hypothetical protein